MSRAKPIRFESREEAVAEMAKAGRDVIGVLIAFELLERVESGDLTVTGELSEMLKLVNAFRQYDEEYRSAVRSTKPYRSCSALSRFHDAD